MVKTKRIIWADIAKRQLREACQYIKKDSPQNAVMVRKDILTSTRALAIHPKLHRADKYKKDNDGNF